MSDPTPGPESSAAAGPVATGPHGDSTAAVSGLATASFLGFGALLVLFGANSSELIAALDLDYADLGLVGSMLSLGLGIGIVGAGPICDRFPRRPVYVAACLLVVGATTTLGAETSFRILLLHTLAIGVGAGCYETVLNTLVVEAFGPHAPRRLLFVHAAATLAASLTPIAFEQLRDLTPIAWYETFRLVGLAHAALVASVAFVPMDTGSIRASQTDTATVSTSAHGEPIALAAICTATFAYVGVESALTLFVADHARADLGFVADRAARTISAFWAGLLLGRLAVGLSPRAPGAGATAALAAIAAGVVTLFGIGLVGAPIVAMALVGFFLGGVFPIMIGLAGIALPQRAGTAVGLAGGLGSLGGFAIPWLTGRVANAIGLGPALAGLGLWLLLLVAAALVARSRLRHRFASTIPSGAAPSGTRPSGARPAASNATDRAGPATDLGEERGIVGE